MELEKKLSINLNFSEELRLDDLKNLNKSAFR